LENTKPGTSRQSDFFKFKNLFGVCEGNPRGSLKDIKRFRLGWRDSHSFWQTVFGLNRQNYQENSFLFLILFLELFSLNSDFVMP